MQSYGAVRSGAQLATEPPLPIYTPEPDPHFPALSLTAFTNPPTVTPGMTLTLDIMLQNAAPNPATDLRLLLPLPPGVELLSGADPGSIRLESLPPRTQAAPGSDPATQPQQPAAPSAPAAEPIPADPYPAPGSGPAAVDKPAVQDAPALSQESASESEQSVAAVQAPGPDRSQEAPGAQVDMPWGSKPLQVPAFTPGKDPEWRLPQLDGQQHMLVHVTLQVRDPLNVDALVFEPRVTVRELPDPILGISGVLVVPANEGPGQAEFAPGREARLQSPNGKVELSLPPQAKSKGMTIRYERLRDIADALRQTGRPVPAGGILGQSALDAFVLTAVDSEGKAVEHFDAPLTLTVRYSEDELRARGLLEGNMKLAFFNEQSLRWEPVETTTDYKTHTVSAQIDHFSTWTLSDGSSPSMAFVPSLQGFQVSDFTGAASYSIPMDVPAGAAGHRPNLGLSYSSAASDGTAGMRSKAQAGWVGKGWSLNTGGSVSRVRHAVGDAWDYFSFSFGGHSYDIVRGAQLPNPNNLDSMDPRIWTWHAVDEGDFLKVRAINPLNSSFFDWVVWTKDGTRYEFRQPLVTSEGVANGNELPYVYQWLLTQVVDVNGNHIDYLYDIQTFWQGFNTHPTYRLSEIRWGYDGSNTAQPNQPPFIGGTARYRVLLESKNRSTGASAGVDTDWEYQTKNPGTGQTFSNTLRLKPTTPHEIWQLDKISLQSKRPGATDFETMGSYALEYYWSVNSVRGDLSGSQTQLTLKRVARIGRDGSQLRWTTFSYDTTSEGPSWNRLTNIKTRFYDAPNNDPDTWDGEISFNYANTFSSTATEYKNYHRITQVLRQDVSGQAYSRSALTTYDYTWDGSTNSARLNDEQSSAKYWYAQYAPSGIGDGRNYLAHTKNTEFRGHGLVTVREYDGASIDPNQLLRVTITQFYRGVPWNTQGGEQVCTPATANGLIVQTDSCYVSMRNAELWKGRPKTIRVFNGGNTLDHITDYTYTFTGFFANNFSTSDNSYSRAGLWRAFTPTQMVREAFNGDYGQNGVGKTTITCYQTDPVYNPVQYGNQTHVLEYNQWLSTVQDSQLTDCGMPTTSVLPVRITRWRYPDQVEQNGVYLPSLIVQQAIFAGNENTLVAVSERFYDEFTSWGIRGMRGLLTMERSSTDVTNRYGTMPIRDQSWLYDSWGNQTHATTYTQAGTRTATQSNGLQYSAPGNGSAARTSSLDIDPFFHTFPLTATNTLGQIERAAYDYRMGTLTKVGGPNVPDYATFAAFSCANANVQMEISCASYDQFGRMASLIRPGDTTTSPTISATYADTAIPFRYQVARKATIASGDTRQDLVQFYDAFGHKIQEKRETEGFYARMIVTDHRYDGLDREIASSQPRYDSTPWDSYTPLTLPLYRETTTQYDGLGRVTRVTRPDTSFMEQRYMQGSLGPVTEQFDEKLHKRRQEYDSLGRLRSVIEYSGNAGSEGLYATYATTSYSYDALDRLTQVVDAKNNTTTIGYDALGRKTSMSDPDMGTWSYSYDVNGTLHTQTDARSIITTFGYDVLDRLTSKSYSNGDGNRSYSYDEASATNGKGQRTSSCVWSGSTCSIATSWVYDGRGRPTSSTQTVNGTALTMGMSYDSADRLRTQTYPGGEVVTTSYDAAGRALSLCSSLGGCYVDNSSATSSYDALDQPVTRKLGNGLTTTWMYNSPLAQLERLTTPGVFDRTYSYDLVGNVRAIRNYTDNQTLNYSYDHRDRLTRAWTVVGVAQAPGSPFQRQATTGPSAAPSALSVEQALQRDQGATLDAPAPVGKIGNGYARPAAPAPQAQSTTTLVQDTFTRTVSNGWGTATTGGSYSTPSQYVSDYSVNGSVGRMRIASASTSRELMLSGAGSRMGQDVDMTVRVATDKLPATGGEMRFILLARRVDGNNDYQGSLRILPAGTIRLEARRSLNGSETTLGSSVTISGLTASANSYLRVRLQVTGTNPTTIKLRVWADTATEPTTWAVTQTDSSAILQQAGAVGLRTQLTTGATNAPVTGSWDDWLATVPSNDPGQTNATLPVYDESYGYDTLGNLTSKAGVSQTYGADGQGHGPGPHQLRTVGGPSNSYSYDNNGNLLSGGNRTLTWNAENQPTQIVSSGTTESYQYDADGSRVTRASGPSGGPSISTRYAFGVYEVEGSISRKYYSLAGQVVALRDSSLGMRYLYGDHLGSISVSTNSVGQRQGVQYFDAWGKRLTGNVSATDRSYTGQYLDDTGLLFYNARYYDPGIGRFVSADSIVPGNASGGMAGVAYKPLTVDVHETSFVSAVNAENQFGPWYSLSDQERQQLGSPWGPVNPQALNRYAYVLNNPMRWTDAGGHAIYIHHEDAVEALKILDDIIDQIQNRRSGDNSMLKLSVTTAARGIGMFLVQLASAILGITIAIGNAIISPDSLGIDLNGNLAYLQVLRALRDSLFEFAMCERNCGVMTLWITSTTTREQNCENPDFCYTVVSYFLNYSWGQNRPKSHEISQAIFRDFAENAGGETNSRDVPNRGPK